MRKLCALVIFFIILSLSLFFPSKALAKEIMSAPKNINPYESFMVNLSGLSKKTCYVFSLFNINTQKYVPPHWSSLTQPCFTDSPNIYQVIDTGNESGDFLMIDGDIPPASYRLSLRKKECKIFNRCSLSIYIAHEEFTIRIPEPFITPSSGSVCSLPYQSSSPQKDCGECIFKKINANPNDLRTLYSNVDLNQCSSQQIISNFCNDPQTSAHCERIKIAECAVVCDIDTTNITNGVIATPSISSSLPNCAQWADLTGTPIDPDQAASNTKNIKCIAIDTAIGPISTEPQAFVRSVFSIVLGLAGGIALFLIMFAGYKMMSSQGNAEQITAAREQFTSAIIGLLFIIFSFVILQIIGVEILKIPGFQP